MKKLNQKLTIKKLAAILLLAAMTVCFGGCSSMALAEGFDEATVQKAAEQIVDYEVAADYESIEAMFRDDLKEVLPAASLEASVNQYFSERGAYQETKSITVVGQQDTNTKEDYAVAVAVVQFENAKITYTISFDADMKVVGLYMK